METKGLTNTLLKSKMTDAMVYRGRVACLEDCVLPGYYTLDGDSTTTEPAPFANWKYGILEVLKRDSDILQRISNIDGGILIQRVKRLKSWKPWFRIEMTQLT